MSVWSWANGSTPLFLSVSSVKNEQVDGERLYSPASALAQVFAFPRQAFSVALELVRELDL